MKEENTQKVDVHFWTDKGNYAVRLRAPIRKLKLSINKFRSGGLANFSG